MNKCYIIYISGHSGTKAQRHKGEWERRVWAGPIKKGPAQNRTFNNKCLI
jgi:hypothetical protein